MQYGFCTVLHRVLQHYVFNRGNRSAVLYAQAHIYTLSLQLIITSYLLVLNEPKHSVLTHVFVFALRFRCCFSVISFCI